jgi:hypothetical protein
MSDMAKKLKKTANLFVRAPVSPVYGEKVILPSKVSVMKHRHERSDERSRDASRDRSARERDHSADSG